MEIQDKKLVQGQGINNAYNQQHHHHQHHSQQPAFNNSNNTFHNSSRFDPNLNNAATTQNISGNGLPSNSTGFDNIILVGGGVSNSVTNEISNLMQLDHSDSRYLNSFSDECRSQVPPPSYDSLAIHHHSDNYQTTSNTNNDFILQDNTGNQMIFHRNDTTSQNHRLYHQPSSLVLDNTDENSAELVSDVQAMIDNYGLARNYDGSSFDDSKNEIIINQFDILGNDESQGINLLIEQNSNVGYLIDQQNSEDDQEVIGPVLDRVQERLLLENTMSPLLAAAETQLANTSLNGIDLFNTISVETTIPTVVENLNAQIEDSCHTTKSNNSSSHDSNANLRIKQEDELVIENSFVPCRAYTSLPTQYLYLNKKSDGEFDVYSKKMIPVSTKFGPFEGVIRNFLPNQMDVLKKAGIEDSKLFLIDETHILDLTDENMSNWMRYVSPAMSLEEKNLELVQCDNEQLFFKSCRLIKPNERLAYALSFEYSQRFGLPYQHDLVSPAKKSVGNTKRPPLLRMSAIKEVDVHLVNDEDILSEDFEALGSENQEDHRMGFIKSEPKSFESEETSNDKENNLFCCRPCQKVFTDAERLEKHNTSVHADDGPIDGLDKNEICPRCRKKFELKSSLNEHMKLHESLDQKSQDNKIGVRTLTCPFCDMKLSQVGLAEHVRQHCVDGMYSCPHCDKKIKKYRLIRRHIRDYHPEIEHPCDQCDKSFKTVKKLQFHLTKHSSIKEFLCADCGKMLKRKDKLNEHIKRFHTGEKHTDDCDEIEVPVIKEPKNKSKRYAKKRAKDESGSEEGESSPKKADKIEKKRKVMVKSPPNDYERFIYKCHDCRLGFKRRGMLVNHLYKRHPDIPIDSVPELNLPILKEQKCYYCQFCDKVYKSSSKRKAHILKYHPGSIDVNEVRSYRNPAFSETVGSIKTEPQACPWCYKQYASKTKLIQHQRIKHPEQMKESGSCWTSQSSVESITVPISSKNHLTVPGQKTKGLQELPTFSSFESEKDFYDVDYSIGTCSQQQHPQNNHQQHPESNSLHHQNSIEMHQVPQSVLEPSVVRLTELTINQNELLDLGPVTTNISSSNAINKQENFGISHLFDDMDFMQLKSVELHCLEDGETKNSNSFSTSTSSSGLLTTLHHNGG
uniref:CSON009833 protein n=1 Tax=Culicoides sonorensis TaxID=179676 RepID=A0A336M4S0_CULSO